MFYIQILLDNVTFRLFFWGIDADRSKSGVVFVVFLTAFNPFPGTAWVEKVIQLYQVSQINHGLMMVGPSGSGKSMAWRVLLKALERLDGVEGVCYVIDPKAISKVGYRDLSLTVVRIFVLTPIEPT